MTRTANLSYSATRLLSQFNTKRARKGVTACEKAGLGRYAYSVLTELVRAGCIKPCGNSGWYIRAA